jgi:hypothetical protein
MSGTHFILGCIGCFWQTASMSVRYDIKTHEDVGMGWAVYDVWTGLTAFVNDCPQIGLSFEDADDLADLLNHLHTARAKVSLN